MKRRARSDLAKVDLASGLRTQVMLVAALVLCSALTGPRAPFNQKSILRRDALAASAFAAISIVAPRAASAGVIAEASGSAAIFANRFSIAGTITGVPPLGQYSKYEDQLATPKGSKALALTVKFEFPQQLQQMDPGVQCSHSSAHQLRAVGW